MLQPQHKIAQPLKQRDSRVRRALAAGAGLALASFRLGGDAGKEVPQNELRFPGTVRLTDTMTAGQRTISVTEQLPPNMAAIITERGPYMVLQQSSAPEQQQITIFSLPSGKLTICNSSGTPQSWTLNNFFPHPEGTAPGTFQAELAKLREQIGAASSAEAVLLQVYLTNALQQHARSLQTRVELSDGGSSLTVSPVYEGFAYAVQETSTLTANTTWSHLSTFTANSTDGSVQKLVLTARSEGQRFFSVNLGRDTGDGALAPHKLPARAAWEANMLKFGRQHAKVFADKSLSPDTRLAAFYYDAAWVYYRIGDYTGDTTWYQFAADAIHVYRDEYVLPNQGRVPGYWIFTRGLLEHWLRTGDELSRRAIVEIAKDAAFAPDWTPLTATQDSELSREVAYVIIAYLNAERVGEPRRERLSLLVDQALGHIEQWTTGKAPYVRPFMVGLTANALLYYYESTGDARVIAPLVAVLDWIWEHTWDQKGKAFSYTDRLINPGDLDLAYDLNLIIAHAFRKLYDITGMPRFLERAEQIFEGGVNGAWLGASKHFNQNYMDSVGLVLSYNWVAP